MHEKIIIFAGGGTLGHVLPTFPVIRLLKENGYNVYFFCSKNGLEYNCLKKNRDIDRIIDIDVVGFKRKIFSFSNIKTIIKYYICKNKCKKLLKKIKPLVVVGMGGYVSGPVMKSAISLKIKTIIHEQNSIYGLVNKNIKSKVDVVLTTYKMNDSKHTLIGNPRLDEFYNKNKKDKSIITKKRILFFGGSRGASIINDFVIDNIDELLQFNFEICLITGNKYYSNKDNKTKIMKISNHKMISIYPFIENMYEYMKQSQIIVCRSGATTISEVFGLGKTVIFIPSPNVVNNHQYYNALYYSSKEMCYLLEEKEIDKLVSLIKNIITKNDFVNMTKRIYENIPLSSDKMFYQEIKKLGG